MLVVRQPGAGVRPLAAETAAGARHVELTDQVGDPDGDTLYFTCCDNARGGSATTDHNGAAAGA